MHAGAAGGKAHIRSQVMEDSLCTCTGIGCKKLKKKKKGEKRSAAPIYYYVVLLWILQHKHACTRTGVQPLAKANNSTCGPESVVRVDVWYDMIKQTTVRVDASSTRVV